MILRPQQIHQLARGEPVTPANFRGGNSNASSSSTTYNYADRRNAVQNGIGVSGDNNSTSYSTATFLNLTDAGAVAAGIGAANHAADVAGTVALQGMGLNGAVANHAADVAGSVAIQGMGLNGAVANHAADVAGGVAWNAINTNAGVATNATNSMADISKSVVAASSHLADVGLSMLQTNTALANELFGGTQQATQAVTGIASQLAQTQIAAQNDNRYLIAAGLAVVAIVGVMAFSRGRG